MITTIYTISSMASLGRDSIAYVRGMMRIDALHDIDDARLAAPAVTEVADAGAVH